MIDGIKRQIVSPSENCEYVALSYVWGSPGSSASIDSSGANRLPDHLPAVIIDVISVTLELGLSYL